MAAGFDKLLDYLLSEIALCGVQGAGSTDFRRFVRAYFEQSNAGNAPQSESQSEPVQPSGDLGRTFYENVWHWVSNHADIQITHKDETRQYSLTEFEAAELQDANAAAAPPVPPTQQSSDTSPSDTDNPSGSLLTTQESLRLRLLKKQHGTSSSVNERGENSSTPPVQQSSSNILEQQHAGSTRSIIRSAPRKNLSNVRANEALFDEPTASTTGPRVFASQNRIWQALTGHGIDLKKVPSMEFILLSLIASRGMNGITQPDLTVMSGQDKRSVPHRTDELFRKGYISKVPVQAGKMRTSLCVHSKFVTKDHFLSSGRVEDVFQYKKFVLSGFIRLLYDKLKDSGVVLSRDIRKKLNVPMSTWNKRAVQGALIRLDQTGMIKRFRAHRKGTDDEWITCIQVLREPREEDLDNLKFRRQVNIDEPDEQLDEDVDGETLMRDLEVDMLNIDESDANGSSEDSGRVPPQWVPDRMLSNILFEVTDLGGSEGWDAEMLRDRIVGRFWRRPMESYVSRVTDDWEKTQPAHLRHLALIRDTRNTQEKKFIHYVYRTYNGFQEAVDKGQAAWAGVTKPAPKQTSTAKGKGKKKLPNHQPLDKWGFPAVDLKEFVGRDGSATLAEVRAAIVHGRKHGPRWDIALTEEIGYQKADKPYSSKAKLMQNAAYLNSRISLNSQDMSDKENGDQSDGQAERTANRATPTALTASNAMTPHSTKSKKQSDRLELTAAQRVALGLKAMGRLSKSVASQIREHRQKTGDPTSIPDRIELDTPSRSAFIPSSSATTPPESNINPERETTPVTSTMTPNGGNPAAPVGITMASVDDTMALVKNIMAPASSSMTPGGNPMTPAGEPVTPIDSTMAGFDNGASPISNTVSPVKSIKQGPLMTKEERIAAGLPARGRLGKDIENQIREQRGLSKLLPKQKKPRNQYANEPPLLSKQQRIDLGINPNGRLPQGLMDGLREERHADIPLDQSSVLKEYLDMLKGIKDGLIHPKTTFTPQTRIKSAFFSQPQGSTASESRPTFGDTRSESPSVVQTKRKADESSDSVRTPKRPRTVVDVPDSIIHTPHQTIDTLQAGEANTVQPVEPPEHAPYMTPAQVDVMPANDTQLDEALPDTQDPSKQQSNSSNSITQPLRASGSRKRATTDLAPEGSIETEDVSLSLETSGVSPEVQLVIDQYMDRRSSGLYINPFAKRKIGRGRPRNAFVVTVKSDLLKNLSWFIPEPAEVSKPPKKKTSKRQSDVNDDVSFIGDDDGMQVQSFESEQPPLQVDSDRSPDDVPEATRDTPHQLDTGPVDFLSGTPPSVTEPTVQEEVRPEVSSVIEDVPMSGVEVNDEPLEALVTASTDSIEQDKPVASEQSHQILDTNTTDRTSSDARPVPSWTPPTWTAINAPARATPTSYQSPYAPVTQQEPTSTQQSEGPDGADETHGSEAEESNIQGVYSAISEVNDEDVRTQKTTYRGNKLGGGSWVTFRHAIIREIIDICKGVYPLHGEIGRPFTTLWEQRHPNIKAPNSSTVLSNMRDMINNPDNGLKKLTFLIKLRQGGALKRREIVAYKHLTPSSPEVMRLAYNMANFPSIKSHQFYPEEIRHLVDETSFYVPVPVAPKDSTVSLDHLSPNIDSRIHEAQLKRRREEYHNKRNEGKARKAQNELVERALDKCAATDGEHQQRQRMRLASLNDKKKRYRRAPLSRTGLEEESGDHAVEQALQTRPVKPLRWQQPWVGPDVGDKQNRMVLETEHQGLQPHPAASMYISWLTVPIVRFYPTNGTFSTEFGLVRGIDVVRDHPIEQLALVPAEQNKGRKRVRIADAPTPVPVKRPRPAYSSQAQTQDSQVTSSSSEESEDFEASSTDEDESDHETAVPQAKPEAPKAKTQAKTNRKPIKKASAPTLLDRLTGLTADPNSSALDISKRKRKPRPDSRTWKDRKPDAVRRPKKKKLDENLEPVNRFKTFCCTLVVASSLAGDGAVDWNIVEKVLGGTDFDLSKTKKLWTWVLNKIPLQISELTANFQTRFIEAYEKSQIDAIEDPETYDWAKLVEWTAKTCIYTEISLPSRREDLEQFAVDEARHEALDRPRWYKDKIADTTRTQLQLQYTFVSPLHQRRSTHRAPQDNTLKARSLIRANTATPYEKYDRNKAHEKLSSMGNNTLTTIMGDYVNQGVMKMRKAKRLMPGRNYDFTARFVRGYGRQFDFEDFMDAVKTKKEMDAAFATADPTKRLYSISRSEGDGSIMAILSLLSEGKVKLVPKLPPIDNELGAPLPRLSIWGFCEGDYVHRSIDRQRFFWDIHILPTANFDFGNPLQPSLLDEPSRNTLWKSLPAPPLPGMQDPAAILPIWNTVDGKGVTWPWWYRIVNMVLQPLIFQPGVTVADIHAHCPDNTVEIFEIELVLGWLESVNAVRKTANAGYMTMPGAWASFGEKLLETETDWIYEHTKRKTKKHEKQVWREEYNLQYSNMRQQVDDHEESHSDASEDDTDARRSRNAVATTDQQILRNPFRQYAFLQQSQSASVSQNEPSAAESASQVETSNTPTPFNSQGQAPQSSDVAGKDNDDIQMGGTDDGTRDVGVNMGEKMDEGM